MFTGFLKYNDMDFTFILNETENELQLIPISKASFESITDMIIFRDLLSKMNEPYLVGTVNENQKKLIAITFQGSNIGQVNNVFYIKLYAYFLLNSNDSEFIDKITFCSPEINRIFNVNRAFNISYKDINDFNKNGVITISTNDFESTSSPLQNFKVDKKDVCVSFRIMRSISTQIGEAPLSLDSCLCFEFGATNDYCFIIKLCHYAKNFIRFLCFRRNIFFTTIDVYTTEEDNTHLNIGKINIFNDNYESEQEPIKSNRCIKYEYILGSEGKILSDIVDNKLYLKHLPKSFEDSKHIDTASFIMITAAFEWEFNRSYPNGIEKSRATKDIEESVSEQIKKLLKNSTGKKKEKYKFLLKFVKSDSLQSEIIQIGKDYSEIIDIFGKHLYRLNRMELKYNEMGKRVSDQRNHFAHGDLDKDFISDALLDVIFLQYIVCALQLKSFGISDENIRKSINDVFHLNLAL